MTSPPPAVLALFGSPRPGAGSPIVVADLTRGAALADAAVVVVVPPAADRPEEVRAAAAGLPRDATLWVLPGRRRGRATVRRAAEEATGRRATAAMLVPGWPAVDHVVPIGAPLGPAARRHLGAGRLAPVLAAAARTAPGRRLLATTVPHLALVVPGAGDAETVHASRHLSLRDDAQVASFAVTDPVVRRVVSHRARGVDEAGRHRVDAETAGLTGVAPGAAGHLRVPHVTASGAGWLQTEAVPGRPLHELVRSRRRLTAVLPPVLDAVDAWSSAAARVGRFDEALLTAVVADPARTVGSARAATRPFTEQLVEDARRRLGDELTLTPSHGDLTTWNVLIDGDAPGVIDWESARAADLPGHDRWYLVADVLAQQRDRDVAEAVASAYEGGETSWPVEELRRAPQLDPGWWDLAFRACWVRHASDEIRRGQPGRFCAIVERLAVRRP